MAAAIQVSVMPVGTDQGVTRARTAIKSLPTCAVIQFSAKAGIFHRLKTRVPTATNPPMAAVIRSNAPAVTSPSKTLNARAIATTSGDAVFIRIRTSDIRTSEIRTAEIRTAEIRTAITPVSSEEYRPAVTRRGWIYGSTVATMPGRFTV